MAAIVIILVLATVSIGTCITVSNDVKNLAAAGTDMGLNIYRKVSQMENSPNLFFSPYSIATALTMTFQGADGVTRQEMSDVLQYTGLSSTDLNSHYKSMIDAIRETNKLYTLNTANRLYGQKGFTFLKPFLDTLNQYFYATMELKDFIAHAETARQEINKWVEMQTAEKIKDLLPEGSLDAASVLVLVNAIYFKGNWATMFNKTETKNEQFFTSESSNIQVPMMRIDKGEFKMAYDTTLKATMIRLPYEGDGNDKGTPEMDDVAMYIILPDEIDGLADVESKLTAAELDRVIQNMYSQPVSPVKIPKFTVTQKFSLKKTLQALGMVQAFGSGADFSGMTGIRYLYIDEVYHQATVEVDEEGTAAAAATGVVLTKSLPKSFIADRPFIFFIREEDTGTTLFLGRYKDPGFKGKTTVPDDADSSSQMALLSWYQLLLLVLITCISRFL